MQNLETESSSYYSSFPDMQHARPCDRAVLLILPASSISPPQTFPCLQSQDASIRLPLSGNLSGLTIPVSLSSVLRLQGAARLRNVDGLRKMSSTVWSGCRRVRDWWRGYKGRYKGILEKCMMETVASSNYTHSLLDISLPLCYNDDNINERSKLK